MKLPKLKKYSYHLKTIDSHTEGEATRIIYDGFPALEGKTMMEKKNYLMENYDFLRTAMMLEPRGHRDMFGALLTEPVHEEADCGVIFMDSGSYLNMCGHGSIGTATMLVETGMVAVKEPYTDVVLDAPSGIIRTRVHVVDGKAVEVSILNVPSFLYKENLKVNIDGWGEIPFDISFGGSFFALVNAESIGLALELQKIETITDLGMKLRKEINKRYEIKHPYLDINTVDLVEFYAHTSTKTADMKNCVIFGDAQADRSPCGTGTSAKLAALYHKGEMGVNDTFVYESITGSTFRGEIDKLVEINGGTGIIPRITGSAWITGLNEWIIDETDPMGNGFLLGSMSAKKKNIRARIVSAAWELFDEKSFEATTVDDILLRAEVSLEEFNSYFRSKEELEHTLGDLFDEKYAQLMVNMNPQFTNYDKLVFLNREMFSLIEKHVPLDLTSHIYVTVPEERQEMLNKKRFYYAIIPQIISEGQHSGEFTREESTSDIAETYASIERGVIYDWCVKRGEGSLVETGQKLLIPYLKSIVSQ